MTPEERLQLLKDSYRRVMERRKVDCVLCGKKFRPENNPAKAKYCPRCISLGDLDFEWIEDATNNVRVSPAWTTTGDCQDPAEPVTSEAWVLHQVVGKDMCSQPLASFARKEDLEKYLRGQLEANPHLQKLRWEVCRRFLEEETREGPLVDLLALYPAPRKRRKYLGLAQKEKP